MAIYGARDGRILVALRDYPDWLDLKVFPRLSGYPDTRSCWLWTGSAGSGYGQVGLPLGEGRTVLVHRVVWLASRGLLGGLVLDHAGPKGCGETRCANPDHLQAVTQRHNVVVTGTGRAADEIRRTTCPQGHPLHGDNLAPDRLPKRICRTRLRQWRIHRYAVIREARNALGLEHRQYLAQYGSSIVIARRLIAMTIESELTA